MFMYIMHVFMCLSPELGSEDEAWTFSRTFSPDASWIVCFVHIFASFMKKHRYDLSFHFNFKGQLRLSS